MANSNLQTTDPIGSPFGANPIQPPEAPSDARLFEYLDVLRRRRWTILCVWAIVLILGVTYTFTRKKMYASSMKLVVVTSKGESGGSIGDLIPGLIGLTQTRTVATQVQIIDSPELLDEAFSNLSPEAQRAGFGSKIIPGWSYKVDNVPETDVVTISTQAYEPKAAADLANSIAATYLKRDLAQNQESTRLARIYVESELKNVRGKLSIATADLERIQRKTGLVAVEAQLAAATEKMFSQRQELDSARSHLAAALSTLKSDEDQLKQTANEIPLSKTVEQNPIFAQQTLELSNLELKRAHDIQEYRPNDVVIQQDDGEIAAKKKALAKTAENIIAAQVTEANPAKLQLYTNWSRDLSAVAGLESEVKVNQQVSDKADQEFLQYPRKERDLGESQQNVKVLSNTYDLLSTNYNTLLIKEKSNVANGYVVSKAGVSPWPASPKVTLFCTFFFVAGLLLAITMAALAERFDVRLNDPQLVERITGLTTLSIIPEIPTPIDGKRPVFTSNTEGLHSFLEGFRILRSNLAFASLGKDLRRMTVVGAGRGEGKTTVALNLALVFAIDNKRVLLIDGDLRRPSIHDAFDLSREVGFTSVVAGRATLESAIQKTEHENLFCLTSGPLPPNPTEFLNSALTRKVVEEASEMFDMIIIDSPPSAGMSDSQIISTMVDGVLLVITLGVTQKPQLEATIRSMRHANAPMLGCVANRVELSRRGYGSYYYGYYYYYAYGYGYSYGGYGYGEEADEKRKRKSKKKKEQDKS